ncbi:MAG: hypothetical protein LUE99_15595 [Bacteroides sp.]|nr:hypothetical protein [Bacteroides sp.]
MKKVAVFLLCMVCNVLLISAQNEADAKPGQQETLAQMEKSINDIRKDLQEKKASVQLCTDG